MLKSVPKHRASGRVRPRALQQPRVAPEDLLGRPAGVLGESRIDVNDARPRLVPRLGFGDQDGVLRHVEHGREDPRLLLARHGARAHRLARPRGPGQEHRNSLPGIVRLRCGHRSPSRRRLRPAPPRRPTRQAEGLHTRSIPRDGTRDPLGPHPAGSRSRCRSRWPGAADDRAAASASDCRTRTCRTAGCIPSTLGCKSRERTHPGARFGDSVLDRRYLGAPRRRAEPGPERRYGSELKET